MGKTFTYKYFKSSWGIYISFDVDVVSYSDYLEKNECVKIADGLHTRFINETINKWNYFFIDMDIKYISYALKYLAKSIIFSSANKTEVLIVFSKLSYNPCDFSYEGLYDAIFEWAKDYFNIDIPEKTITFDRDSNYYYYVYSDSEINEFLLDALSDKYYKKFFKKRIKKIRKKAIELNLGVKQ